jgi:hypothetical protein
MGQLKTLTRHNYGFNRALTKVLVKTNINQNYIHKKKNNGRKKIKTRKNLLLDVAFDSSSKLVCIFLQRLEAYL